MKIVCGFNLWNDVPNRDPNRVVVMKAHSINESNKRARLKKFTVADRASTLVFMTARDDGETGVEKALRDEFGLHVS